MADDRDERIRQRAYEIWQKEGAPEGRQAEHWQQAEREIDGETEPKRGKKAAAKPAKSEAEKPKKGRAKKA